MAIRANVSFTKKLGQPDYGSVGAGCSLDVELDSRMLELDPDAVRGQLGLAYLACRQAVEKQLSSFEQPHRPTNGRDPALESQPVTSARPSTQSQRRALWAICNRNGLNLEAVCQDEFQARNPDELDIRQASVLIDKLKSQLPTAGGAA